MGKSGATVSFWDRPSGAADRRGGPAWGGKFRVGPVPLGRGEKASTQSMQLAIAHSQIEKRDLNYSEILKCIR